MRAAWELPRRRSEARRDAKNADRTCAACVLLHRGSTRTMLAGFPPFDVLTTACGVRTLASLGTRRERMDHRRGRRPSFALAAGAAVLQMESDPGDFVGESRRVARADPAAGNSAPPAPEPWRHPSRFVLALLLSLATL